MEVPVLVEEVSLVERSWANFRRFWGRWEAEAGAGAGAGVDIV